MKKLFSVVLPIYNNEKNLNNTISYIMDNLSLFPNYDVEIVMVNDGSRDNSYEIMKELQKKYPKYITIANLERNFGQGSCTECGISLAKGDVIGVISADLQDPFEEFVTMLEWWEKGYKFVYGVREKREDAKTYAFFSNFVHRFMNKHVVKDWPMGGCDFYLADRSVMENYLSIPKIKIVSSLATYLFLTNNRKAISYTRKKREGGKSGYNFKSRVSTFVNWIYYNSEYAIKALGFMGAGFAILGFVLWILFLLMRWNLANLLIGMGIVFFGWNVAMLWSIAHYIWLLLEMNKKLPRFIISETIYRDEKGNEE